MSRIFKIALGAIVLLVPLTVAAQNQEHILSFNSDITVSADSSMIVTETIRVETLGDQIKHGIYRDFPIAYRDFAGHRYLVSFELLEVTRDGSSEGYHIERSGNGERIYIGREEVLLTPGEHEYTIKYKTARQLGFFEDHDELYWNVTGNGWVFPIDSATARVNLPGNIPKDKITATLYTGIQGSNAQEGTYAITDNAVEFKTSRVLGSYEGLTIVVGWPKGVVTPPTAVQNFFAMLWANLDYIAGIFGFLIIFTFYFYMWRRHGRDPLGGTIIAQYDAPQGFSPALLRFIRRMGSDSRTFAAAIINMGVKGKLSITENKGFLKKKTFTLTKKNDKPKADLSVEEKFLEDNFFANVNSFELKTSNAAAISKIRENFSDSLKQQAGKKYFSKNIPAVVLGIILSAGVAVGTAAAALSVRFGIASALQVLFWPIFLLALLAVNIVFVRLMRAYTVEGRKLADEIEGFKLFLTVTEKDRLTFHNPPEKTPELFERMLPYALALGVEHEWAQQFADVFARLDERGTNYAPVWFYGSLGHFSPDSFADTIGSSFTGVVSSSSAPPGSGSGFSGGGSGGGGGGGGGGGW